MNIRLEWNGDSCIYLFDHRFNYDIVLISKSLFLRPSIMNLREPVKTLNVQEEGKHREIIE